MEKNCVIGRQGCKYFYDFTLFQREFCGIRTELKSSSMKVLKAFICSVVLALNYTLQRNRRKFWWKNKRDLGVGILSYKGAIYTHKRTRTHNISCCYKYLCIANPEIYLTRRNTHSYLCYEHTVWCFMLINKHTVMNSEQLAVLQCTLLRNMLINENQRKGRMQILFQENTGNAFLLTGNTVKCLLVNRQHCEMPFC